MRTSIGLLPVIAMAVTSPAMGQSRTKEMVENSGETPSATASGDHSLISEASRKAMERDANRQAEIEANVPLVEREKARTPQGWWSQLWDAIHAFDFGTIVKLLLQPVPLSVIAIAGFGTWLLRRRR